MSAQRVFVASVDLENYRGLIPRVRVSFNPHLTVMAGVNGSGKSSLLDVLSSTLSVVPEILRKRATSPYGMASSDVGPHGDRSSCRLELSYFEHAIELVSNVSLRHEEKPRSVVVTRDVFRTMRTAVEHDDRGVLLPVLEFIHSSSTRMPREHPRNHEHPRLVGYHGFLDSEALQFQQLEEWFEQEENLENEKRIRRGNLNLTIPSLRAVRGAVETFLSHLHQSRLANLKVVRFHAKGPLEPASGKLAMDKDGQQLMLTQLSDGERRLVLMVADIARRMAILNPALADPLQSPGIILVDEIELHLHPLWQRTVVPALQAAFPNVQFLLTTHSPQVLASVPDECVVILKDGQAMPGHPRVHGRDTNTILEQTMGASARPPEVQARIDEVYSLLDRRPEDARARLEALEAELGDDEPDLVRARAMMDFVGA